MCTKTGDLGDEGHEQSTRWENTRSAILEDTRVLVMRDAPEKEADQGAVRAWCRGSRRDLVRKTGARGWVRGAVVLAQDKDEE